MINDVAYGYENVTIVVAGKELNGITAISYSDKVNNSEKIAGSGVDDIDETEGSVSAEDGEMTLHEYEYRNLIESLGPGFLRKKSRFSVTVSYAHDGEPVITDTLQKVRLLGTGADLAKGDTPMKKVPIRIMKILWGGANGNQLDPTAA